MQEWLKRIGVGSFSELNEDEKNTYREYEEALSGRKITDKDIQDFFENELSTAVSRLTEVNLSKEDEIFRKVEVRLIKKIISFINAPQVEKQFAKQAMEQLIKK